jgi:FKBP-type peptidyl-prolyl cis-trans isomerase 2
MNEGDVVLLDYIGRIKDTGVAFDITNEEVAKKEKVYDPRVKYAPVPVIVGAGFVLKALDNVLKEMKVGEKRVVELTPENAFGERKEELIKLIPVSFFKDSKPAVGSYVSVDNFKGRVMSINGGRVKVDFNHPLAGKNLEYEIEVINQVTEMQEKVKCVINYFTGLNNNSIETKLTDGTVEVKLKNHLDLQKNLKEAVVETIFKWIEGIKEIVFVDVYNK